MNPINDIRNPLDIPEIKAYSKDFYIDFLDRDFPVDDETYIYVEYNKNRNWKKYGMDDDPDAPDFRIKFKLYPKL